MRNGRDVAQVDPRQVPAGGLAQLMIGRPVTDLYPRHRAAPARPF